MLPNVRDVITSADVSHVFADPLRLAVSAESSLSEAVAFRGAIAILADIRAERIVAGLLGIVGALRNRE